MLNFKHNPVPFIMISLAFWGWAVPVQGAWVLLDTFDDDLIGTLDGQSNSQGVWDTDSEATARVSVIADGTNQVLSVRANSNDSSTGSREFAGPLGSLSIPDSSSAATLYLRFRHNGDGGSQRFGLWDQGGTNASAADVNGLDLQFILLDDLALAPNKFRLVSRLTGSSNVTLDNSLDVGTWYSMWVVIDQTTDTYDVYLKGGAYTVQTLIRSDIDFRNATSTTLNGFAGQGTYNATYTVTSYLDDIHLDPSGVNLSEPVSPEPPALKTYDVYLIAGQSNADGRGYTNLLTGELAAFAGTQANVRIFFANPANSDPVNPTYKTGWVALKTGYAVPPGFSGALPSDRFGFELSFGRALAEHHPDRNIALLKVTRGGTSLSADWDPAGGANYMWQTFTNQVPAALAALATGGNSYTIRGMIWHQGESDGGNPTFQADLTQFIGATRAFLGLPELAFAIGELERDDVTPTVSSRTYQLQAMASVAAADPFSGIVSSAGFLTIDGTHFDTPSVIAFGQRYAEAIEDIDSDNLPDAWETHYFGSITNSAGGASDDWDHDFFSDRSELGAGTDPSKPESLLAIRSLSAVETAGFVLTWSSVTGKTYQVQHTTTLSTGWTNLHSNILATPPLNTYTATVERASSRFFRIQVNVTP
jgi:hypothetical protein